LARSPLVLLALVLAAGWAAVARGHGDSLSTLRLAIRDDSVHVSLTLAFRDLSEWVEVGPSDYPAAVAAEMRASAGQLIEMKYDDAVVQPKGFTVSTATVGSVIVDWTYPPAAAVESVQVQSLHLGRLPIGHHQSFFAEDERAARGKHLQQALLANETLGREENLAIVDVPRAKTSASAATPDESSLRVVPSTKAFFSNGYFRLVILGGVIAVICWLLMSIRSNLKRAAPISAADQPGRSP
jgi:hypothetical protein